MTLDESIQGMRLQIMRRAAAVGVSAACRETGISRTLFYRWQHRLSRYGVDGLHPRRLRARPGPAPQLPPASFLSGETGAGKSRVAAAVALRRLGYHVVVRPTGVIVDAVEPGSHAAGKLQPADVITEVSGAPTLTIAALRAQLARVHPGATVTLRVRRGGKLVALTVATIADPSEPGRTIIGFQPEQAADIQLPLRVQISSGDIGGPSAGLAFALEVMEKLGRNVDRGYRVAATGEMLLDGTVAPIGGVKQKTIGAREANADVFLVPAGDNATEARRYAHGLRIIAVQSFPQALRALATLPPKR